METFSRLIFYTCNWNGDLLTHFFSVRNGKTPDGCYKITLHRTVDHPCRHTSQNSHFLLPFWPTRGCFFRAKQERCREVRRQDCKYARSRGPVGVPNNLLSGRHHSTPKTKKKHMKYFTRNRCAAAAAAFVAAH